MLTSGVLGGGVTGGGVPGGATRTVSETRPGVPELFVADHVQQRCRAADGPVEIGPLSHRGADQRAAVGSALDAELFLAVPSGIDQMLRRCVEIIEDVLLTGAVAGLMLGAAFLAAAS